MDIVVGTAGHIDHGKTALVRTLTGTDTDRLPEEKTRGITIDIGFAELAAGEHHFAFVDVPGHERFVKNMLAGASGIDLVLLVIAADEGVMPQTREHFEICRLLGLKTGVVVLTKCDLVRDPDLLELARADAADLTKSSFLESAPVVNFSARTGEGREELTAALMDAARAIPLRDDARIMRMPIDRSFSVKGFGTVVTGTLASGTIHESDELLIMPPARSVRVRGIQSHGRPSTAAGAGRRVAVNLGGIEHAEIRRGMVLTGGRHVLPTQILDAEVEVIRGVRAIRDRQRVRVHLGTAEVLARVAVIDPAQQLAAGETGLVQLRTEAPVVAVPGDRFIIRSYSPPTTIAGGCIIDAQAAKHRRKDHEPTADHLTRLLDAGDDRLATLLLLIDGSGSHGISTNELLARTGWNEAVLNESVGAAASARRIAVTGTQHFAAGLVSKLADETLTVLREAHRREPLATGITRETVREAVSARMSAELFKLVITRLEAARKIESDGVMLRLADHSTRLSPAEKRFAAALRECYAKAGLEPQKLADAVEAASAAASVSPETSQKLVQLLITRGELVRIDAQFCFDAGAIEGLKKRLLEYAESAPGRVIDVAGFKDLAGVSRKFAIPLLEYFDREKVTARAADKRVIL